MKRLRTSVIAILIAANLVASVLADILFWALAPMLPGQLDESMNALLNSAVEVTITLIIFAVFVVLIINEMTHPIAQLSDAAKKIARGEFNVEISQSKRRDEIGMLERNFQAMVQQLNSTESLQKDFIRNVSHEFKTPLTILSGYAKMLTDNSLTKQEQEQCSHFIVEESRRLSQMVSNILLLSRLDNQGIRPLFDHFSLDEQLRQCVLLLEPKWREQNLELDIQQQAVKIKGNEELLNHVWSNLLENAIKFSRPKGRISIRSYSDKKFAAVKIQDNGIGMDEETKAKVFDQFYQGDISRDKDGYGLGLSLVKRIVDLHQGTLSVESRKGEGSTFTVRLPVSPD